MNIRTTLTEKIAGEITVSPKPGQTIRKWREIFKISQTELAHFLDVSPSVISDYESGRRKSPGIQTVKKIIEAILDIDEKKHNSKVIRHYQSFTREAEGILEIMEYPYSIPVKKFIDRIEGSLLTSKVDVTRDIRGFTLIDSVKTIQSLNSTGYTHLYGWSTDRALIFTGVTYGRGPMIAIRIHPVKPTIVVYHKPGSVDPLAVSLAEHENIPLVVTNLSLDELKKRLISLGKETI